MRPWLAALLLCLAGAAQGQELKLAKLQAWQSGRFTIYTSRGEPQVQQLVTGLAQFQQTLETLLSRKAVDNGVPTRIFILDEADWHHLRPYEGMDGVFLSGRFENHLGLVGDGDPEQTLRMIFHEYTHYFLRSNYNHDYPAWYQEGLAELLATASFENFAATFRIPPARLLDVQNSTWIPLDRLLAIDAKSPEYLEHSLARGFYGQSWLLLHYAMVENPEFGKKMFDYLKRLSRREPQAEAARAAFGDLEAADRELQAHSRREELKTGRVTIGEAPAFELSASREVPAIEALTQFGDFMVALRLEPGRIEPVASAMEALSPGSPEAAILRLKIANLRDDSGEFSRGSAALVPRLAAGDWQSRRELGTLLFDRTMKLANRAKLDPTSPDLKLALRLFDEGLALQPEDSELLWGYGASAVRLQKNFPLAEKRLQAVSKKMPTSDAVALALALLYGQQLKLDKMISLLGEVIQHTRQPEIRRWALDTREKAVQILREQQRVREQQKQQAKSEPG